MIAHPAIRRRGEAGSVAVEMAVTLSALLLLIAGAVEFSLALWNWNSMLLAVEEAGRYAMLYNPTSLQNGNLTLAQVCPSGVASVTLYNCAVAWANQNWGSPYGITCTDPSTGSPCTGSSTQMVFRATYTFNFITSVSLSRAIQVPVI